MDAPQMRALNRNPGSFRDPSGYVYSSGDSIYRTISEKAVGTYQRLTNNSFFEKLDSTGFFIGFEEVDIKDKVDVPSDAEALVEHPKVPFVSYPYEWSFSQLKAAALLHLDLQLFCLENDVSLSDASAYNIQFLGSRPVFIDMLSFRPYEDGEYWLGHQQFCQQFLNPLLLRAKIGIAHNSYYRGSLEGVPTDDLAHLLRWRDKCSWNVISQVVLPAKLQRKAAGMKQSDIKKSTAKKLPKNGYRALLLQLRRWIENLRPADSAPTTWAIYAECNTYSSEEFNKKRDFISHFVEACKPDMLWDLGCNTGEYSEVAIKAGAENVVGFDFDQQALDRAYARATQNDLPFLPLYLDAANPSPSQGWGQSERSGLAQRVNADAIIALAFIHHLVIGKNIPLDWAIGWLVDFAPRGVIEFVAKSDPTVQQMLAIREDIFDGYTEEAFATALEGRARIIKCEPISKSERSLYWYEVQD